MQLILSCLLFEFHCFFSYFLIKKLSLALRDVLLWLVRGYQYFVGDNKAFPSIILHEVVLNFNKADESQVSNCSKYSINVRLKKKRIGQHKVMSISQYVEYYC